MPIPTLILSGVLITLVLILLHVRHLTCALALLTRPWAPLVLPHLRPTLLTAQELTLYTTLCAVAEPYNLHVFPKVSLIHLFLLDHSQPHPSVPHPAELYAEYVLVTAQATRPVAAIFLERNGATSAADRRRHTATLSALNNTRLPVLEISQHITRDQLQQLLDSTLPRQVTGVIGR